MSQMEVMICTNFVNYASAPILTPVHNSLTYLRRNTEREKKAHIGVNARHFTLDQSRKLECKPKNRLIYKTRPFDCAPILIRRLDRSTAASNGSAWISHSNIAQQLNIVLVLIFLRQVKESRLSCKIWRINFSWREIKLVRLYIFQHIQYLLLRIEPLRGSERASNEIDCLRRLNRARSETMHKC